ncbi:hypothetical protein L1987_12756 [Smallanthus sonchifolius]|uniref:Uncharacterized protein n=1 Tax=Smallanthus sonchifolius TaxID=185202 RepID=A0ACB9JEN9_9ASTR|nr:hypothetical protein L1987_12756 [Smallanthus sonchifolius]
MFIHFLHENTIYLAVASYHRIHSSFNRDRVNEGQLNKVLLNEMDNIRKRHHTRFFPDRHKNTTDRGGNILPGTVVDTRSVT